MAGTITTLTNAQRDMNNVSMESGLDGRNNGLEWVKKQKPGMSQWSPA